LAFGAFLFLIGRSLSHRVAGPVYAFERFVKNFISGKPQKLKLRKSDEFVHLESLSQLMMDNLAVSDKAPVEIVPLLPRGSANHQFVEPLSTQISS
jgi:hypothetical protein